MDEAEGIVASGDNGDDMSVSVGSNDNNAIIKRRPATTASTNDPNAPFDERACWIVVTAVADFWAQRDLWMDAEMILGQ